MEKPNPVSWWLYVMDLAADWYAKTKEGEPKFSTLLQPPECVLVGPSQATAQLVALAYK